VTVEFDELRLDLPDIEHVLARADYPVA